MRHFLILNYQNSLCTAIFKPFHEIAKKLAFQKLFEISQNYKCALSQNIVVSCFDKRFAVKAHTKLQIINELKLLCFYGSDIQKRTFLIKEKGAFI